MNIRVVLSLSLVAILMGAATSFGLTQNLEWVLWVVIALFSAYLIAKRGRQRPMLNGFLVGLLCGILNSATESVLFESYIANNPSAAERLAKISLGIDPKTFILLSGTIIGLAAGVLFGILGLLASRLEGPSSSDSPPKG